MRRLELYFVALNDVAYVSSERTVFNAADPYDVSAALDYAWTEYEEAAAAATILKGKVKELALVDPE